MSGQFGFWAKRVSKLTRYSMRSRNYRKSMKADDRLRYASDRAFCQTDLKFADWLIQEIQWETELRFEYHN